LTSWFEIFTSLQSLEFWRCVSNSNSSLLEMPPGTLSESSPLSLLENSVQNFIQIVKLLTLLSPLCDEMWESTHTFKFNETRSVIGLGYWLCPQQFSGVFPEMRDQSNFSLHQTWVSDIYRDLRQRVKGLGSRDLKFILHMARSQTSMIHYLIAYCTPYVTRSVVLSTDVVLSGDSRSITWSISR